MTNLKLVSPSLTEDACTLMAHLESIVSDVVTVSRSTYGQGKERLLLWYIDVNEGETDAAQVRIIFDPNKLHYDRQGMHTTLDIDAHELVSKLDEALKDNFSTIWIHA
jgi:hypothetical protein